MATIRAYTTIEQSRKLAEILPLESADMTYCAVVEGARDKTTIRGWEIVTGTKKWEVSINAIKNNSFSYRNGYIVPCWSLAALLAVLPNGNMLVKTTDGEYYYLAKDIMTKHYNNAIDACYEIVIKLHEKGLL